MSITLTQIGSMEAVTPDAQPPAVAPHRASPGSEGAQPAGWQPPQFSTAIRIDDQRRIYYEVINDHTGQVVLQIPPEVVRNIGDGINQFLQSLHPARSIDVKS